MKSSPSTSSHADTTLAENKNNFQYWYSVLDIIRLLTNVRRTTLLYARDDGSEFDKVVGDEFSAHRENRHKTLITNPYFHSTGFSNFRASLRDDLTRTAHWLPTTLIIPVLMGAHWISLRIQIDREADVAEILYVDPFGLAPQDPEFFSSLAHDLGVSRSNVIYKNFDQQGRGYNGWDCGPITILNIIDFANTSRPNRDLVDRGNYRIKYPFTDLSGTRALHADEIAVFSGSNPVELADDMITVIRKSVKERESPLPSDIIEFIERLDDIKLERFLQLVETKRILGGKAPSEDLTADQYKEVISQFSLGNGRTILMSPLKNDPLAERESLILLGLSQALKSRDWEAYRNHFSNLNELAKKNPYLISMALTDTSEHCLLNESMKCDNPTVVFSFLTFLKSLRPRDFRIYLTMLNMRTLPNVCIATEALDEKKFEFLNKRMENFISDLPYFQSEDQFLRKALRHTEDSLTDPSVTSSTRNLLVNFANSDKPFWGMAILTHFPIIFANPLFNENPSELISIAEEFLSLIPIPLHEDCKIILYQKLLFCAFQAKNFELVKYVCDDLESMIRSSDTSNIQLQKIYWLLGYNKEYLARNAFKSRSEPCSIRLINLIIELYSKIDSIKPRVIIRLISQEYANEGEFDNAFVFLDIISSNIPKLRNDIRSAAIHATIEIAERGDPEKIHTSLIVFRKFLELPEDLSADLIIDEKFSGELLQQTREMISKMPDLSGYVALMSLLMSEPFRREISILLDYCPTLANVLHFIAPRIGINPSSKIINFKEFALQYEFLKELIKHPHIESYKPALINLFLTVSLSKPLLINFKPITPYSAPTRPPKPPRPLRRVEDDFDLDDIVMVYRAPEIAPPRISTPSPEVKLIYAESLAHFTTSISHISHAAEHPSIYERSNIRELLMHILSSKNPSSLQSIFDNLIQNREFKYLNLLLCNLIEILEEPTIEDSTDPAKLESLKEPILVYSFFANCLSQTCRFLDKRQPEWKAELIEALNEPAASSHSRTSTSSIMRHPPIPQISKYVQFLSIACYAAEHFDSTQLRDFLEIFGPISTDNPLIEYFIQKSLKRGANQDSIERLIKIIDILGSSGTLSYELLCRIRAELFNNNLSLSNQSKVSTIILAKAHEIAAQTDELNHFWRIIFSGHKLHTDEFEFIAINLLDLDDLHALLPADLRLEPESDSILFVLNLLTEFPNYLKICTSQTKRDHIIQVVIKLLAVLERLNFQPQSKAEIEILLRNCILHSIIDRDNNLLNVALKLHHYTQESRFSNYLRDVLNDSNSIFALLKLRERLPAMVDRSHYTSSHHAQFLLESSSFLKTNPLISWDDYVDAFRLFDARVQKLVCSQYAALARRKFWQHIMLHDDINEFLKGVPEENHTHIISSFLLAIPSYIELAKLTEAERLRFNINAKATLPYIKSLLVDIDSLSLIIDLFLKCEDISEHHLVSFYDKLVRRRLHLTEVFSDVSPLMNNLKVRLLREIMKYNQYERDAEDGLEFVFDEPTFCETFPITSSLNLSSLGWSKYNLYEDDAKISYILDAAEERDLGNDVKMIETPFQYLQSKRFGSLVEIMRGDFAFNYGFIRNIKDSLPPQSDEESSPDYALFLLNFLPSELSVSLFNREDINEIFSHVMVFFKLQADTTSSTRLLDSLTANNFYVRNLKEHLNLESNLLLLDALDWTFQYCHIGSNAETANLIESLLFTILENITSIHYGGPRDLSVSSSSSSHERSPTIYGTDIGELIINFRSNDHSFSTVISSCLKSLTNYLMNSDLEVDFRFFEALFVSLGKIEAFASEMRDSANFVKEYFKFYGIDHKTSIVELRTENILRFEQLLKTFSESSIPFLQWIKEVISIARGDPIIFEGIADYIEKHTLLSVADQRDLALETLDLLVLHPHVSSFHPILKIFDRLELQSEVIMRFPEFLGAANTIRDWQPLIDLTSYCLKLVEADPHYFSRLLELDVISDDFIENLHARTSGLFDDPINPNVLKNMLLIWHHDYSLSHYSIQKFENPETTSCIKGFILAHRDEFADILSKSFPTFENIIIALREEDSSLATNLFMNSLSGPARSYHSLILGLHYLDKFKPYDSMDSDWVSSTLDDILSTDALFEMVRNSRDLPQLNAFSSSSRHCDRLFVPALHMSKDLQDQIFYHEYSIPALTSIFVEPSRQYRLGYQNLACSTLHCNLIDLHLKMDPKNRKNISIIANYCSELIMLNKISYSIKIYDITSRFEFSPPPGRRVLSSAHEGPPSDGVLSEILSNILYRDGNVTCLESYFSFITSISASSFCLVSRSQYDSIFDQLNDANLSAISEPKSDPEKLRNIAIKLKIMTILNTCSILDLAKLVNSGDLTQKGFLKLIEAIDYINTNNLNPSDFFRSMLAINPLLRTCKGDPFPLLGPSTMRNIASFLSNASTLALKAAFETKNCGTFDGMEIFNSDHPPVYNIEDIIFKILPMGTTHIRRTGRDAW